MPASPPRASTSRSYAGTMPWSEPPSITLSYPSMCHGREWPQSVIRSFSRSRRTDQSRTAVGWLAAFLDPRPCDGAGRLAGTGPAVSLAAGVLIRRRRGPGGRSGTGPIGFPGIGPFGWGRVGDNPPQKNPSEREDGHGRVGKKECRRFWRTNRCIRHLGFGTGSWPSMIPEHYAVRS
jgi:hypothetical protein